MMVEDDAPGSQLGITATTIIAKQYQELRDSDPCHYEYIFDSQWQKVFEGVTFAGE